MLPHYSMLWVSLATPGTEACDAMGGAFRPQWRELPASVLRLSLPCCPKRSRIDAKHGDHFLLADLNLLIGLMPNCVTSSAECLGSLRRTLGQPLTEAQSGD